MFAGLCLALTGCPSFRSFPPDGGAAGADGSSRDSADGPGDAAQDLAPETSPPPLDGGDGGNVDGLVDSGQVIPTGPVCSTDRWCWESPLPQGNDIGAVWGSSPNAVWAVGDVGTTLFWGGSRWSATPSGTTLRLNGVWGTGKDDVWAVGDKGTIIRWTGSKWARPTPPTTVDLRAVWASGPTDAWAVGAQGSILHWSGQWVLQPTPDGITVPTDLSMVWGAGPDDVWFAGASGIVRHNGSNWTSIANFSDAGVHITALSGSGSTVIATGADATGQNIYVYLWSDADKKWGRIFTDAGPPLTALVVKSASSIWAAGSNQIRTFDGTSWKTQFTNGVGLTGLWLAPSGDGWAAGKTGQMVRFDGATWTEPSPVRPRTLTDIWWNAAASSAVDGGASVDGGDGGARDGSSAGDGGGDAGLRDGGLLDRGGPIVWVSGFDPAAAAHHGGIVLRGQEGAWDPVALGDVAPLWSVWSQDGSVVWAAGETLLHGDTSGTAWTSSGAVAPYRRVRGSSSTSIWSVENTVHYSNRMMPWPQDGSQIWGLAVFSDYDVWAAASSGRTLHWTTNPVPHWNQDPPAAHALYAIGGVSTADLWAVGDMGVMRHWDQTQWTDVPSNTTQPLRGVWARTSHDVWAVGGAGTILHWDGAHWSPSPSGTTRLLYAVVGDAAGNVWAVGEQSTILHRSP